MKIKTTEQISDAWDKQIGNPPYPLSSKKWVAVDSFKKELEDIYTACNDKRVFEIQKMLADLIKSIGGKEE